MAAADKQATNNDDRQTQLNKICSQRSPASVPERLRGVFTTRRYTNTRLPLPLPYLGRGPLGQRRAQRERSRKGEDGEEEDESDEGKVNNTVP